MRAFFFFALCWALQGYTAFNLTWGLPAISLDSNPPMGDSDLSAKIAIDSKGNAIAAWGRTTGKGAAEDIWVSVYNHAVRVWSGPVKISGGENASRPMVAMDPSGYGVLVWEEGFPSQIVSRTLTSEGVWTPPLSESPQWICPSIHAQMLPQIEIDAAGHAVAIWMEISGRMHCIQSARKPIEAAWIDLGMISSGKKKALLCTVKPLALNSKGEGIAVWEEINSQSGAGEIHGAHFVDGKWTLPFAIAAEDQRRARNPSAGIDENGNAVIVWNQDHTIQSKTLINGLLATSSLPVSNPAFLSDHPRVGVDAAGNAVAVFERYDVGPGSPPTNQFIAAATLPFFGTSWTPPVDISGPSVQTPGTPSVGHPLLSLNSVGEGVAIWKEYNGKNVALQGAGFALGTWSLLRTLSLPQSGSGAAFDPAIAINLAGNIVAIWPEDTSGINAHQIKATFGVGLALPNPPPPFIGAAEIQPPLPNKASKMLNKKVGVEETASAIQVLHRFPAHGDLINILNWSSHGDVAYYKIYRGDLSTLIGTTKTPHFEDHQRIPHKMETYLITSVDSNDQESAPMTLFVQPRR